MALVVLVGACAAVGTGGESPEELQDVPGGDTASDTAGGNPLSDVSAGGDALLAEALAHYRELDLPEDGIPPGFLEVDRLYGECIASFGFPVYEHELARASGVYFFESGDQRERIEAVGSACETGLRRLDVLLPAGRQAHEIRYASFVGVFDCLVSHGYPTVVPPSLETFIENPSSWHPWQAMNGAAESILPTPDVVASDEFAAYFESLEVCPRP